MMRVPLGNNAAKFRCVATTALPTGGLIFTEPISPPRSPQEVTWEAAKSVKSLIPFWSRSIPIDPLPDKVLLTAVKDRLAKVAERRLTER